MERERENNENQNSYQSSIEFASCVAKREKRDKKRHLESHVINRVMLRI